jgi:hypothetical protein
VETLDFVDVHLLFSSLNDGDKGLGGLAFCICFSGFWVYNRGKCESKTSQISCVSDSSIIFFDVASNNVHLDEKISH